MDFDNLEEFAKSNNLSQDEIATSPITRKYLQSQIDQVNSLFARVEHVRKFTVLDRALSVEDGELTPTLKVKRKIVYDHFAAEIEAMYAE